MNSSIFKVIVLVVGLVLAVVMGNLLVTDSLTAFLWIAGVSVVVVTVYLERKIWLLIPFLGSMELALRLPGGPSTMMLAQLWFIGFSLVLFLMRRFPWRPRFSELELWVLILSIMLLQVYVRNPVGVNIFGGGSVGGKPYALYVMNLVTAMLLAGLAVNPKELKISVWLSILGGLVNLGISIISALVPSVGFWFGASLTRGEANYEDVGKTYDPGQASRIGFLGTFGRNASLWIASFKSPLKACFHPLWAPLLIATVIAAGMSGFRNSVVMIGLTYLIGIMYRGGVGATLISVFGGVLLIIGLAIGNMVMPLPPNVQRSLSFLPGTWEERYIRDASESSDWRFEIWREVLTSKKYIRNKWFGDGLGFSSEDYKKSVTAAMGRHTTGISGFDEHRENILISGDYHSGPVQTIRIIGYVGLLLLLLAQIRLAVHAHRQIMRAKNTEWFPVALFVGIPLIWNPIFFVFVFGDFKTAAATLLLGIGMVRMLENNLPLPAYARGNRLPYLLPTRQGRTPLQVAVSSKRI
jgi:hypothetical protein